MKVSLCNICYEENFVISEPCSNNCNIDVCTECDEKMEYICPTCKVNKGDLVIDIQQNIIVRTLQGHSRRKLWKFKILFWIILSIIGVVLCLFYYSTKEDFKICLSNITDLPKKCITIDDTVYNITIYEELNKCCYSKVYLRRYSTGITFWGIITIFTNIVFLC